MTPPPGREADYTLTEDLATHARAWLLRQKSLAPDRPVFMYVAPGGHTRVAGAGTLDCALRGKFDMGWDEYRRVVFAQQKRLGVIPQDAG